MGHPDTAEALLVVELVDVLEVAELSDEELELSAELDVDEIECEEEVPDGSPPD